MEVYVELTFIPFMSFIVNRSCSRLAEKQLLSVYNMTSELANVGVNFLKSDEDAGPWLRCQSLISVTSPNKTHLKAGIRYSWSMGYGLFRSAEVLYVNKQ